MPRLPVDKYGCCPEYRHKREMTEIIAEYIKDSKRKNKESKKKPVTGKKRGRPRKNKKGK
jgi:hypothetical protein